MGQPWDPQSIHQLLTCIWKILKPEPLELQKTHPGCGKGLWMTPLSYREWNKDNIQHINSIDEAITFTVEDTRPNGSMPFLDTILLPEHNITLSISVYRKPTHTNQ